MDDLVQWLRAQLDEDERIARAAADVRGPVWWYEGYFGDVDGQVLAGDVLDGGSAAVRSLAMTTRSDAEGEHVARHDPARVLGEIEATRGIVRAYEAAVAAFNDSGPAMANYDRLTGSVSSLRGSLELLATVYDDRPGFQESWRP